MGRVSVSVTRDYFLRDGEKFFYLADTCWSAFTNPSLDEWRQYLDYRRMQGFNVLQINVLPQHDRSEPDSYIEPFETLPDGGWNFNRRSGEYFGRAEKFVEMAVERGFTPALVVLWCNYVRGTWGSKITPNRIMPLEYVEEYVAYVAERFGKYDPIFVISGDTDFETEESIKYYKVALDTVKKICPDSLTTMHLAGGLWNIPEEFVKSPNYDFYMYQSGHSVERQQLAYELAQRFRGMPVKRPVVNGEPCYEGHSHGGKYGRFGRFDVRRAIWQSLLSGAKAGTAYGAHGVWSWHKRGRVFWGERFSGPPFEWSTALSFPGAFDASFAKWVFERYDLFDIEPANERLLNQTSEIRVSEGGDKIVVYAPYCWEIRLRLDEVPREWEGIELESRRIFKPAVKTFSDYTAIEMPDFNSDVLFIGFKT
ncbi:MAG: DUF4038 domain-containing protein [Nitrososphaerota archaeon]|nr:DUF4038 domain-containing protein [Candidatus Calditenuaceae archaeon]MDW8074023.1 DUF4038 domain-containing protein [Nitrososphaerota archaeon]